MNPLATPLTADEERFLELLSAALRGTEPDPARFTALGDRSWRRIHRLATSHAIPAFVGDRILMLPAEALPNRDMRLMIFSEIELTKRANKYLIKALGELAQFYREQDLEFLQLKGLSLACYYPDPLLRTGGDLDVLFLSDGDYELANDLLLGAGYHLHDESEVRYGHSAFTYGRTIVENHARAVFFDHKRHNQAFEAAFRRDLQAGRLTQQVIGQTEIATFSAELNVVYVFVHLFFHWLHWGVGFRQYCDWLLLMTRLQGQLDQARILTLIQELEILYPMQLFAQVAIRHLEADPAIFPFPLLEQEDDYAELLIRDILQSGNFGFAQRPEKTPYRWLMNWRKFWFKYQRSRRLSRITPVHSSRILWGSVLGHLQLLLRPRR